MDQKQKIRGKGHTTWVAHTSLAVHITSTIETYQNESTEISAYIASYLR